MTLQALVQCAGDATVTPVDVKNGKDLFVSGNYITFDDAGTNVVYKATADMAGDLDMSTTSSIAWDKYVRSGGEWYRALPTETFTGGPQMASTGGSGRSDDWIATDDYATNDVVRYNNQYWKTNGDPTAGDVQELPQLGN